jgi:hypothetical protein
MYDGSMPIGLPEDHREAGTYDDIIFLDIAAIFNNNASQSPRSVALGLQHF